MGNASASMTSVRMDEELLNLFQEVVRKGAGKLKGAQSEAINEAVLLWLAHKGEMNAISFTADGREYVLAPRDFAERLQAALQKPDSIRCEVRFLGPGSSESFLVQFLDMALGQFGKPREAVVEELDEGRILARIDLAHGKSGSAKDWVRKMYELEDGNHGRLALKVSWAKVWCQIEPDGFVYLATVHKIKGFEAFEVVARTQGPSRQV